MALIVAGFRDFSSGYPHFGVESFVHGLAAGYSSGVYMRANPEEVLRAWFKEVGFFSTRIPIGLDSGWTLQLWICTVLLLAKSALRGVPWMNFRKRK